MMRAPFRPRSSRLHLLIAATVVALVPWYVVPGRTVADTKIDLVVDPWSYLGRSLSAWDPEAFFGQLQNQAYGYLFPMGPFFGVTRSLGIPEWACQRMWWSLVLVVGFAGAYGLVRRWGIAGDRVALLAALVYALSPRVLTVLGSISAEAWPAALVPWLLLGADRLLRAGSRAERRRAGAGLGLLVVAIGGVNATATIAALAVPTVYLVAAGRGGARALAWWAGVVAVATAWWTVPLIVLGKYAYPFLDFIESSATTTRFLSIPNILRGTSHWIAYVPFGSSAEWPAGALLATSGWLIVATMAVAVLGLVGLLLRPDPRARDAARHGHIRRFAVLSVVVGVALMGAGFGHGLGVPFVSPVAGDVDTLLDGGLAAFRNLHKFDPLVRLPLCLGLAALVSRVDMAAIGRRIAPRRAAPATIGRAVVLLPLLLVVFLAVSPAVRVDLAPRGAFDQIPTRWRDASAAVDAMAARDGGRTLIAPATRYGTFTWGSTADHPLEVLASSDIVNRSAIPLGSPSAIRIMDALDGVLTRGAGDPGLIPVLDRLGISRVVVSHDALQHLRDTSLEPTGKSSPDLTERTLQSSGLRRAASWGTGTSRISLWSTGHRIDRAEVLDESAAVSFTGGPEAVIGLVESGRLGAGSAAWLQPEGAARGSWVQTDTLKKRDLNVASGVGEEYSQTLRSGQASGSGRVAADFPPAGDLPATVREFRGVEDIAVSSSLADPYALSHRGAQTAVASAVDGDLDTAWTSAPDDSRPTLTLRLARPAFVGSLKLQLASGDDVGRVGAVVVDAGPGPATTVMTDGASSASVPLNRRIDRLSIRLVRDRSGAGGSVGIANLAVEGLDISTGLRLPSSEAAAAGSVVLTRDEPEDGARLTRYFQQTAAQPVERVVLRARRTTAVERLLDGWQVSGPRYDTDVDARPGAALDQDPRTRWTVGYLAGDPQLTVGWPSPQTITGIGQIVLGGRGVATRVTVTDPDTGDSRTARKGATTFAPLTAKRVVVTVHLAGDASFPVRVPDLTLRGAGTPPSAQPASHVTIACSSGVQVTVGGRTTVYSATASRRQLAEGGRIDGRRCAGPVAGTEPGDNTFVGASSDVVSLDGATIGTAPTSGPATSGRVDVITWSDRKRVVTTPARDRDSVLAVHEGFNAGWHATAGGRDLAAVEVDGWRQGFVVPAGTRGPMTMTFAPDRSYRLGLLIGAGLVLLLVAAASWPARRSAERVVRDAEVPRWAAAVLGVVVGALLGGWGGLAIAVVAVALPVRWRLASALGAGLVLVLVVPHWPLPSADSWVSLIPSVLGIFLVVSLAAAVASASSGGPAAGPAKLRPAVHEPEDGRLHEAPREIGEPDRDGQGHQADHHE